jgi:hypothetical protein
MKSIHRGSSTIVDSRLGLAGVGTQLKVENTVPLRTISNFDLLPSPRASYCCRATLIYPKVLIKNQLKIKTRRYTAGGDANIARKKSARHWREFIDENGGGPGVRLRKRQRKKD